MKTLCTFFTGIVMVLSSHSTVYAADNKPKKLTGMERAKQFFASREAKALEQKFVGVHTSKGIQEGLFPIKSTGVSTKPIVDAAKAYLAQLDNIKREKTLFAVDDIEWRQWLNVDNGIYDRKGVSLKEMTSSQKALAFKMLKASLSARGLQQTRDIMKTDQTLRELNNGAPHLDEELYFITIMGEPSETQPWGWQIDGHHLAINYFILGDQVVFSPAFMGAEPVLATSGKHKGNLLFQDEQNFGLALMQSFDKSQQDKARIDEKRRENLKAAGFQDNLTLDYQGVSAKSMTPKQRADLLALTEQYIGKMREGHAKVKMADVQKHIDNTWFAWAGDTTDDGVFYYRIHSPVVLIEFDHQAPVGVPSKDRNPTRNHIHTMIRTPNGNDYGKDLLRQHLKKHHH
ncbi:MAG: DUF3500 domain-containing protein [Psychrobium sp.]